MATRIGQLRSFTSKRKPAKTLVDGKYVDNYICHPCPPGTTSPPRSTSASHCTGRTYGEQLSAQNQLIGQITKTLSASKNAENNINAGLVTKLQRMWATNEVRKKYDEMRAEHASKYLPNNKMRVPAVVGQLGKKAYSSHQMRICTLCHYLLLAIQFNDTTSM